MVPWSTEVAGGQNKLGTKARLVSPVAGFSKRSVLFVFISGHRHSDKI